MAAVEVLGMPSKKESLILTVKVRLTLPCAHAGPKQHCHAYRRTCWAITKNAFEHAVGNDQASSPDCRLIGEAGFSRAHCMH